MQPYSKTFRICKDHKAKDCTLCAEQVQETKKPTRRKSKEEIKEVIRKGAGDE